jgi:hypothetical protein
MAKGEASAFERIHSKAMIKADLEAHNGLKEAEAAYEAQGGLFTLIGALISGALAYKAAEAGNPEPAIVLVAGTVVLATATINQFRKASRYVDEVVSPREMTEILDK